MNLHHFIQKTNQNNISKEEESTVHSAVVSITKSSVVRSKTLVVMFVCALFLISTVIGCGKNDKNQENDTTTSTSVKTAEAVVYKDWADMASPESDFEFGTASKMISKYTGPGGVVWIPETIQGVPVEGIAINVFSAGDVAGNGDMVKKITAIMVPTTVKTIGNHAFSELPALEEVVFADPAAKDEFGKSAIVTADGTHVMVDTKGEGLQSMAGGAFMGSLIQSVHLPQTVTTLGEDCFKDCVKLTEVVIPSNVSELDKGLFSGCSFKIVIPDTVKKIGNESFSGFTTDEIVVPENVTSIGEQAFSNSNIQRIILEGDFDFISGVAFNNSAFKEILFEGSVTEFGSYDNLFRSNPHLEKLKLPEGMTATPGGLKDSTNLKSVTLPSTIKTLSGFEGCSFEELIIPEGATEVAAYAFRDFETDELILPASVTSFDTGAFMATKIKHLTIKGDLTTIGNSLFKDAEFESLTFEGKAEGLLDDEMVFLFCKNLKKIKLPAMDTTIPQMFSSPNETLESVVIPGGIREIAEGTFTDCKALKEVMIQNGVETIGKQAFSYCELLESIEIPSSVKRIEMEAFAGCYKLGNIELNEGLQHIGRAAFYNTYQYGSGVLDVPASVTSFEPGAFTYLGAQRLIMNSPEIPGILDGIDAFGEPVSETIFYDLESYYVMFGKGVKKIADGAFNESRNYIIAFPEARSIEDLPEFTGEIFSIADDRTNRVGGYTFPKDMYPELIWDTFDTHLESIGTSTFSMPTPGEEFFLDRELARGDIEGENNKITKYTQNDIKNLAIHYFNSGMWTDGIADGVFADHNEFESVAISELCQFIGADAFSGCKNVKKVTLSASTEEIGQNAFAGVAANCEFFVPVYATDKEIAAVEGLLKASGLSDVKVQRST